jgi:hypothetical protein
MHRTLQALVQSKLFHITTQRQGNAGSEGVQGTAPDRRIRHHVPLLIGLAGCSTAPSQSILGSYFPSWMLCIFAGLGATIIVRQLLGVAGLEKTLPAPLLVSLAFVVAFSFATWLVWLMSNNNHPIKGHVESVGRTLSRVVVAQRFPVRIRLDAPPARLARQAAPARTVLPSAAELDGNGGTPAVARQQREDRSRPAI